MRGFSLPPAPYRFAVGSAVAVPLAQQLGQPRDIDPARLVLRQHLGLHRVGFGVAGVDVDQVLSVGVADDVSARCLVGAWWRECRTIAKLLGLLLGCLRRLECRSRLMGAPNCFEESAADPPLPLPYQGHQLANLIVGVVLDPFIPDEHCQHHFGL